MIAPLPEMNLSQHPWGGDPAGFTDGYGRIRDAFLDQGLTPNQIRFVFAPNGLGEGSYSDYYPGNSVVDIVGFAKLNRGDPWRDYEVTFQQHIDLMQTTLTRTKPILITQTGSVDGPRDRAAWLDDMFTRLLDNDQVIGAIYFNRDKDVDFRVLVNGSLDPAFANGYQSWSPPNEISWIFDGGMGDGLLCPGPGGHVRGHLLGRSRHHLRVEHHLAITEGYYPGLQSTSQHPVLPQRIRHQGPDGGVPGTSAESRAECK
jgi:hypothetical protein